MMKQLAVIFIAFVFLATVFFQSETGNATQRGKGLDEAIKHVPDFVAEKLQYMINLFSQGISGIGQSLSDWISQFFNPPGRNNTRNSTQ